MVGYIISMTRKCSEKCNKPFNFYSAIQEIKSAEEVRSRRWESLCALRQIVDVVDTKQAESCVCSGVVFVPVSLTYVVGLTEFSPLVGHGRVRRQSDIAGKAEDSLWHAGGFEGLVVEANVPYTRCTVLRSARRTCVEEELLAGSMVQESTLISSDRRSCKGCARKSVSIVPSETG